MDFKELLLEADRKHQEAAKKSQLVKRINTNFTTPAMKDEKSRHPRSEAVQKLLDEKRREERRKREAEKRKKMEIEKARQEREREEKRKNTFRIPKKTATEDAPSDVESFSSISSGDEPKLSSSSTAKPETHLGVHKSSSSHGDSEKSHRSSSQSHRSSSSHRHSEKKDGHSHKTSEHSSSSSHHSSKHRSSEHTSRGQGDHHSEKEKTKHHSDKYRHSSSGRHEPGSSKTHSSCEKEKSHGSFGSHSKTSEHGLHKNSRTEQKDSRTEQKDKCVTIRDKAIIVAENESSGYVTSPDISSEEEEEQLPASKPSLAKNHAHNTNVKERTKSAGSVQRNHSTDAAEETISAPVTLTRHHLKPTIDRTGGSVEERAKILEKLQAIRERMAENESGSNRKRASWGEVKKRRAKREKLDGDFTGSCMEKIDYDEEEKPSLKRPEPRPEVPTEKASKENKEKRGNKERVDKVKNSKKVVSEKHERKLDSKAPHKFNRFDEMQEKPKVKARPQPRPPPVNFSDLMKLAEQKQAQPVIIETAPKKEKERRPMTQEELDRKQAREDRLKSKDYQDWYKYGNNSANKKQSKPENTESPSGGFLHPTHNVIPAESQSKPFSIPRKSDKPGCAKPDKHSTTPVTNRPSDSQSSVNHSVPTSKSKPHPTRPGMIANKPQSMAKYMNSEEKHKSSSSSRDTSQPRPSSSSSSSRDTSQPRPSSSSSSSSRDTSSGPRLQTSGGAPVDRTKEGNAWDRLFSRPEYKKMTEPPASKKRKMVIDSEEEEEYDDEMDDFIDDEGEEDLGSVSSMIQKMFGYDKRKYRHDDDDDRNMEVGFREVMKEEARSARLGLQEDLEDIRREQEELRQKALKKKMRK